MTAPPDRGADAAVEPHATRRVFSESLAYMAIDAAQNLLALIVVPASLWWLTPADMGTVTLALIGVQIAMTLATIGLDFAVIRFYLVWPEPERPGRVAGVLRVVAGGAGTVIVVGAATTLTAAGGFVPAIAEHAIAILASMTAGAALGLRAIPLAVFRVTSDFGRYTRVVLAGSLAQAMLQIGLLAAGTGLAGFLVGTSVAAWLSAALALVLLARAGRIGAARHPDGVVFRLGGWSFASTLMNRLIANADRFAVGWWGTMDTLGVYGTAARWTMPLRMVSGGTKMAIAPALSRSEAGGGALEAMATPIAGLVTLLALLAGLLQVAALSLLLTPWQPLVGEFQRLLSVLLAAQIGNSLALIGQLFLYYRGRSAQSAGLTALSVGITLAGLAWLVPRFGALGAAVAQLAASVALLASVSAAGARMAWLPARGVRSLAVLSAGLIGPWILPAWGSTLVTLAATGLLARWAWDDLRSTIRLRRLG